MNRKSNHKNLGIVKSSNLCVAPETKILTSEGYKVISELKDQEVEVFNGDRFSSVIVKQTGQNQNFLQLRQVEDKLYDALLIINSMSMKMKKIKKKLWLKHKISKKECLLLITVYRNSQEKMTKLL